MKKLILAITFGFTFATVFAQSIEKPQLLKYITTAPDGSIAITITDDSRNNSMKLESAESFYKYQLIDIKNGKSVYSSANHGKECNFNKSKVIAGTYNLKLFTRKFIITSEILITPSETETEAIAFNENK